MNEPVVIIPQIRTLHENDPCLSQLTEPQKKAIFHPDGALLVLAGAGTGKTKVLMTRIANRLSKGDLLPAHILALTFTKKAANEMKSRLANMIGDVANIMDIGTFHSILAKAMRDLDGAGGVSSGFTVIDESDQKVLFRTALIEEFGSNEAQYIIKNYKETELLENLSRAKMIGLYGNKGPDFTEMKKNSDLKPERILEAYENMKKKNVVFDYDDVLFHFAEALKDPLVLKMYQSRWKMILVDEYQDTNVVQEIILKKLAEKHNNITCVGDDDQSIYSFRQADVKNILEFQKRWNSSNVIKLERNFRSSKDILDTANSLIRHNKLRHGKELVAHNPQGKAVTITAYENNYKEADAVINNILNQIENSSLKKEIAIITRTAAALQDIEQRLLQNRLAYTMSAGKKISDRVETKTLGAFIKLVANPNDETAFRYAFESQSRGIGPKRMEEMTRTARNGNTTLESVIRQYGEAGGEIDAKGKITDVSKLRAHNAKQFCDTISHFRNMVRMGDDVETILEDIIENSGIDIVLKERFESDIKKINTDYDRSKELYNNGKLKDYQFENAQKNHEKSIKEAEVADKKRRDNIHSLRISAKTAENLEDLAAEIILSSDRDEEGKDAIWLGTIHAAKGLEFDHVHLPAFEDGILPSVQSETSSEIYKKEEERNLAYVALTRARLTVNISYANQRLLWGKMQGGPSSFIKDLKVAKNL